jgi:hypothetical protein
VKKLVTSLRAISTIQRVYSVLTGKELAEEEEDASAFERDDEDPLPDPQGAGNERVAR